MDIFDAFQVLEAVELLKYWRFLLCLAVAAGIAFLLWRSGPAQFSAGTVLLVFGPALVAGVLWERKVRRR